MTIFYRRSGERISRATVRKAKERFALSYRTGIGVAGKGSRQINPRLADRWAGMTEEEFCRESGAFTYRTSH